MNYSQRSKQRSYKRLLKKSLELLQFKSTYISFPKKTVLSGSCIALISLFLPWIKNTQDSITWNSFTSLSGNMGFIILPVLVFLIIILLSSRHKEQFKLHSSMSFKDYTVAGVIGAILVGIGIISMSFIDGLETFSDSIVYGNGIILCLCGSILIIIGSIFMRQEHKKSYIGTAFNDAEKVVIDTSNNTKLPF